MVAHFLLIVLGIGQGGAFGVALLLLALRTEDPHPGAQLSALAQTVGYVAGGLIGPFAVGVIYDWSASWAVVEVFYVAVGAASLACGLGRRARPYRRGQAPARSIQLARSPPNQVFDRAAINQFAPCLP